MPAIRHSQGIYRVDSPKNGTYAWIVVLTRNRESFRKHFTDGVHGGREQALAAAIGYRDEIVARFAPLKRSEYVSVLRKNNTSGHPGVRLNRDAEGNPLYWAASWVPHAGAKAKVVKFSVSKYGFDRAKELAVRARADGVAQMEGYYKPVDGDDASRPVVARATPGPKPAPRGWKEGMRIRRAYVTRVHVALLLVNDALFRLPLDWFPALREAKVAERSQWTLSDDGQTITWPELNLAINPTQMIRKPNSGSGS
ncbi:MAG TPA: DUF2442 domain-containing protein [Burkholderiales bacterium]|jgi:hypothetical protein